MRELISKIFPGQNPTRKIKFQHIYYILSGFSLFVIIGSLCLNSKIMDSYTNAEETNHQWANRLGKIFGLNQSVIIANGPGNDVFYSKDVETEKAKHVQAIIMFDEQYRIIEQDFKNILNPDIREPLLLILGNVSSAMQERLEENEKIFSYFEKNNLREAGEHMAKMNRKFAKTQFYLEKLVKKVNEIRDNGFRTHIEEAKNFKRFEYPFGILILILVGCVVMYGNSISRQLKSDEEAKEKSFAAAKNNERALKLRVDDLLKAKRLLEQVGETLREAQRRNKAIVDHATEAIITINEKGIIKSYNPAAEKIFGYTKEDAICRNISFLMPEPHQNQHDSYLQRYLNSGEKKVIGMTRQFQGKRKNGSNLNIELSITEIEALGEIQFLGIVRDISERAQMQSQLNHAQKMESIGELAAGIAHEINTPMQFIGDNTRFLQESFVDLMDLQDKILKLFKAGRGGNLSSEKFEELKTAAETIDIEYLKDEIPQAIQQSLEGIKRVSNIVKAMKEFSHPGSEEKVPIDINRAIETTVTVARNEWKYVADIEKDLDPDLPPTPCYANDFNQVILNTIVNGAHAIKDVVKDNESKKGTITITTRKKDDWVEVRIKDTGTGVPEGIRDKIFDPFFTTKEVGKGTGQGLSYVHTVVVKKHGGAIALETEEGKGSTFIFRFPLSPEAIGVQA